VRDLTPSQKGAVAEAEIAAAATRLGLVVLRPLCDGARYDLGIDVGSRVLRVQCKWAARLEDVLMIHVTTCRHTPRGYLRTTYSDDEIDAVAAYSEATDRCYLLPIADIADRSAISLCLTPTRNNQAQGVRWAEDYELTRSMRRHYDADLSPHADAGREGDTMTVPGL
jgi:PD-(D/E)XK endonuclease